MRAHRYRVPAKKPSGKKSNALLPNVAENSAKRQKSWAYHVPHFGNAGANTNCTDSKSQKAITNRRADYTCLDLIQASHVSKCSGHPQKRLLSKRCEDVLK